MGENRKEVLARAGVSVVHGVGALGTPGRSSQAALAADGGVFDIQPRFTDERDCAPRQRVAKPGELPGAIEFGSV